MVNLSGGERSEGALRPASQPFASLRASADALRVTGVVSKCLGIGIVKGGLTF
jgi:hypothetical protein